MAQHYNLYFTISTMENAALEMNPIVRFMVIAVIIAIPFLLVILTRLDVLRELLNHPGAQDQERKDLHWILKFGAEKNVSICPKCCCQNPPENKFCGQCGTEIVQKKEK